MGRAGLGFGARRSRLSSELRADRVRLIYNGPGITTARHRERGRFPSIELATFRYTFRTTARSAPVPTLKT